MKYKTINPKETVFYVFETSDNKFSMFDSEIDEAIYLGREWNMVRGIVKNIKKILSKKDILLINNLKLNSRPTEIEPEIFYKIAKLYEKR